MTIKKSKKNLSLWILAIVVVIFVIFASLLYLTPMGGGGGPISPCTAQSGFICQNISLSASTDNLTVTLGQNTGSNWNNVYFVFVPLGTKHNSSGVPEVSFVQPNATHVSNIASGASAMVNLTTAQQSSLTKGQQVTGFIWVKYTINGTNQTSYAQMASINIKAS